MGFRVRVERTNKPTECERESETRINRQQNDKLMFSMRVLKATSLHQQARMFNVHNMCGAR